MRCAIVRTSEREGEPKQPRQQETVITGSEARSKEDCLEGKVRQFYKIVQTVQAIPKCKAQLEAEYGQVWIITTQQKQGVHEEERNKT